MLLYFYIDHSSTLYSIIIYHYYIAFHDWSVSYCVKKITKGQTKQGKKEAKPNITVYFYNENSARVAPMRSTLYSNASSEQYHTVNYSNQGIQNDKRIM